MPRGMDGFGIDWYIKGMAFGLLMSEKGVCTFYAHWTEIRCVFHPGLALGILFTIITQAV